MAGQPKLLVKPKELVTPKETSRYYRVKVSGDVFKPLISVRGKIEPDAAIREIMETYDKLKKEFRTRGKVLKF